MPAALILSHSTRPCSHATHKRRVRRRRQTTRSRRCGGTGARWRRQTICRCAPRRCARHDVKRPLAGCLRVPAAAQHSAKPPCTPRATGAEVPKCDLAALTALLLPLLSSCTPHMHARSSSGTKRQTPPAPSAPRPSLDAACCCKGARPPPPPPRCPCRCQPLGQQCALHAHGRATLGSALCLTPQRPALVCPPRLLPRLATGLASLPPARRCWAWPPPPLSPSCCPRALRPRWTRYVETSA